MSTAIAIRDNLRKLEPEFEPLLPANVTPRQFTRVVMTAVQNNPSLMSADQASLFSACMKAAEDGLVPDGTQAALVTFGTKVQYMRMVAGLIEKLYDTGLVRNVDCRKVLEGDHFNWEQGTNERIDHVRKLGNPEAPIIAVYSVIEMTNGSKSTHVMETWEVNEIRDTFAKSPDKGPWMTRWEAMAFKTCLRQHCKTKKLKGNFAALFADHDELFDVRPMKNVTGASGIEAATTLLESNHE